MGAEEALNRLLEVKLSAPVAYKVAKLVKIVRNETGYFKEQQEKLVREFGEPAPEIGNGAYRVKQEHIITYMAKIGDVAGVETSISVMKLTLQELPEITGGDLLKLEKLLNGDEG